MPTFLSEFGQAAAAISASVGGYVEFLSAHFGAYATARSVGEFMLLCIVGVVLVQLLRVRDLLAHLRKAPAEMESEMERLQREVETLSHTIARLRADNRVPVSRTAVKEAV